MACRAIFLDFDDTLHDFRRAYDRAFATATAPVCAAAGMEPAELGRRVERPWAATWEDFVAGRHDETGLWAARTGAVLAAAGLPGGHDVAKDFAARYIAAMRAALRLFPDAVDALDLAQAARPRPRLGILTNGPQGVQRARIAHLDLTARVDFVVVSGEIGVAKPDPAFFAAALRLAGCAPPDAVMIGDNPVADIAGAKGAGLRAVWLDRAGAGWPGIAPTPDRTARDLVQAVRWALG